MPLSMLLAFSTNILFILSRTLFHSSVYRVLFFHAVSNFLQKVLNFFLRNSTPLFVFDTLIFFSIWFSKRALNSLNMSMPSNFYLRKYNNLFLENKSINNMGHTHLLKNGTDIGPNVSLCTCIIFLPPS